MFRLVPGLRSSPQGAPETLNDESAIPTHTTSPSWQANILALILLLVPAGLASGCDLLVSAPASGYPTPPPALASPGAHRVPTAPQAPNPHELHDLAIAAVDFDPALNARPILAGMGKTDKTGKPHALLVAVENKGNRPEGPFTVSLQLLTGDRRQVLMSSRRTVPLLASGDVTVVRFPVENTPPVECAYILDTQVQPAPHDADITNNRRTLEISLNSASQPR